MQINCGFFTYTPKEPNNKKQEKAKRNQLNTFENNSGFVTTCRHYPVSFHGTVRTKMKLKACSNNIIKLLPDEIPDTKINITLKNIEKLKPEIIESIRDLSDIEGLDIEDINKIKKILCMKFGINKEDYSTLTEIQKTLGYPQYKDEFDFLNKLSNKLLLEQMEINKLLIRQRKTELKKIFIQETFDYPLYFNKITTKSQLSDKIRLMPKNGSNSFKIKLDNILKNFDDTFDENSRLQKQIIELMFGLKDEQILSDYQIIKKLNISKKEFYKLKTQALIKIIVLKDKNFIPINDKSKLQYMVAGLRVKELKKIFPKMNFDEIFTKKLLVLKLNETTSTGKSLKTILEETLNDEKFNIDENSRLKKQIFELIYGLNKKRVSSDIRILSDIHVQRNLHLSVKRFKELKEDSINMVIGILKENNSAEVSEIKTSTNILESILGIEPEKLSRSEIKKLLIKSENSKTQNNNINGRAILSKVKLLKKIFPEETFIGIRDKQKLADKMTETLNGISIKDRLENVIKEISTNDSYLTELKDFFKTDYKYNFTIEEIKEKWDKIQKIFELYFGLFDKEMVEQSQIVDKANIELGKSETVPILRDQGIEFIVKVINEKQRINNENAFRCTVISS